MTLLLHTHNTSKYPNSEIFVEFCPTSASAVVVLVELIGTLGNTFPMMQGGPRGAAGALGVVGVTGGTG